MEFIAKEMKKTINKSTVTNNGVRQGFSVKDTYHLNKYDSASANPRIQTFSDEDLEEPEEMKRYYCAICKSRLKQMPKLEAWQCTSCLEVYDIKYLQDSVLKSIDDFKLAPYFAFRRYPQLDENDPSQPFVKSISIDDDNQQEDTSEDFQVIRSSADQRIQHIKVRGSPVDAMRMMQEHETGQQRTQEE